MRDEGEEGAGGAPEADEPAYHARRPMNAFLIFCKRHRAVVRDKYPNLENRSITKILGEWWAHLEDKDKSCYTGLAKEYKDAFFSANPDFKWYKLPAPPLRTLAPPRAPDPPPQPASPEPANNNSTRFDFNKRRPPSCDEPPATFTPGKLADEAHMGGLSHLLTSQKRDEFRHYAHAVKPPEQPRSREDTIQELQDALSETTRLFEDFDDKRVTQQEIIEQVVDRGVREERSEWDDRPKSGRSCKGKRYQEFMAGGLLASKRARAGDWECASPERDAKAERGDTPDPEAESDDVKFRPADFDLEARIAALPSLSLENFQARKRENKKKKRSGFSIKPREPALGPERARAATGSQKRKPRKISITRLDVNSMLNRTADIHSTPVMKIATEAPHSIQTSFQQAHTMTAPQSVDLFALATLAEVAANTSKMESSKMADCNLMAADRNGMDAENFNTLVMGNMAVRPFDGYHNRF